MANNPRKEQLEQEVIRKIISGMSFIYAGKDDPNELLYQKGDMTILVEKREEGLFVDLIYWTDTRTGQEKYSYVESFVHEILQK